MIGITIGSSIKQTPGIITEILSSDKINNYFSKKVKMKLSYFVLIFILIFSVIDELHQGLLGYFSDSDWYFSKYRSADILDVLADMIGALFFLFIEKLFNRKNKTLNFNK